MTDFPCFTAPGLAGIPGLRHAFLGRLDRLADAPPVCSHGKRDPLCHAKTALGLEGRRITTLRQVHGKRIIDVPETGLKEAGEGDALATDRPGVFLGVRTADCVPVLLVDPDARACAAVHAGWRGTLAGVAAAAVAHLRGRYGCEPARLRAALGPAIGRCCFEVGPEVIAAFEKKMGGAFEAFVDREGEKGRVDLRGLVARELVEAGVPPGALESVGGCTFCGGADFHSYRRDRRAEGRQIAFLGFAG